MAKIVVFGSDGDVGVAPRIRPRVTNFVGPVRMLGRGVLGLADFDEDGHLDVGGDTPTGTLTALLNDSY